MRRYLPQPPRLANPTSHTHPDAPNFYTSNPQKTLDNSKAHTQDTKMATTPDPSTLSSIQIIFYMVSLGTALNYIDAQIETLWDELENMVSGRIKHNIRSPISNAVKAELP